MKFDNTSELMARYMQRVRLERSDSYMLRFIFRTYEFQPSILSLMKFGNWTMLNWSIGTSQRESLEQSGRNILFSMLERANCSFSLISL